MYLVTAEAVKLLWWCSSSQVSSYKASEQVLVISSLQVINSH